MNSFHSLGCKLEQPEAFQDGRDVFVVMVTVVKGGGGRRAVGPEPYVSLGQSFEDGVDLLSDGCQGELKLVLETREF